MIYIYKGLFWFLGTVEKYYSKGRDKLESGVVLLKRSRYFAVTEKVGSSNSMHLFKIIVLKPKPQYDCVWRRGIWEMIR